MSPYTYAQLNNIRLCAGVNKRGKNTFDDIMIKSESTRFECFYSEPKHIARHVYHSLSLSQSLFHPLSLSQLYMLAVILLKNYTLSQERTYLGPTKTVFLPNPTCHAIGQPV